MIFHIEHNYKKIVLQGNCCYRGFFSGWYCAEAIYEFGFYDFVGRILHLFRSVVVSAVRLQKQKQPAWWSAMAAAQCRPKENQWQVFLALLNTI
jgi:hypothetical protein